MLSDNIRKYRKANYMSQDELAEKLEVTRQSISLWETGQTQPSLDNIIALAKLFNISTDNLLTDDESAPADTVTVPSPPEHPQNKKIHILFLVAGIVFILAFLLTVFLWNNKTPKDDIPVNSVFTESTDSTEETESLEIIEETAEPSTEEEPSKEIVESKTTSETSKPAVKNDPPATSKEPQNVVSKETAPPKEEPKPVVKKDLFGYLKDFVIAKGTLNGDYCYYSKPANNYGGYSSEDFSLYYWGDTDKIEFCLHSVMDDTFSVNFYLYVPKNHTGNYEYISSYYYRDNGESLYEAKGTINAGSFTRNYPLNCSRYIGSTDKQNDFMEMSRQGICDLIDCLKNFIKVENLEYSFSDFGFTAF